MGWIEGQTLPLNPFFVDARKVMSLQCEVSRSFFTKGETMCKPRYLLLYTVLMLLIATGPSFAMGLQAVSDSELDGVHARGLDFLFDANSLMSGGIINNLTLKNSIMLSGARSRTVSAW